MSRPIIPPYCKDENHGCPEWARPQIQLVPLFMSVHERKENDTEDYGWEETVEEEYRPKFPKGKREKKPKSELQRKTPMNRPIGRSLNQSLKGQGESQADIRKRRAKAVEECDKLYRKVKKSEWAKGTQYVHCYTCHRPFCKDEITVGHFHSRRFTAIRWDDRNIRPQCLKCNQDMEGASGADVARLVYAEFQERLIAEIGQDAYDWMESHKTDKFYTPDIEALIVELRAKLHKW